MVNLPDGEVDLLLVEDSPDDIRLALRAVGKTNPLRVAVVMDGEEAIEFLFCRGRYAVRSALPVPKLVLLDLKLPRLDGFEVLKAIKRDPETQSIPVVVFTSSDQQRDIRECYRLGANSYVQKPSDLDAFTFVIRKIETYWFGVNEIPGHVHGAAKDLAAENGVGNGDSEPGDSGPEPGGSRRGDSKRGDTEQ